MEGDETWGAGNSILSGITHMLSAGCIMNGFGCEIARQPLSELEPSF